jgi:hypothetical protein
LFGELFLFRDFHLALLLSDQPLACALKGRSASERLVRLLQFADGALGLPTSGEPLGKVALRVDNGDRRLSTSTVTRQEGLTDWWRFAKRLWNTRQDCETSLEVPLLPQRACVTSTS